MMTIAATGGSNALLPAGQHLAVLHSHFQDAGSLIISIVVILIVIITTITPHFQDHLYVQYVELNQFQNEFRELSNKFQENEKIIQVNFDELQIIMFIAEFSLSEKVKLIHFDWQNIFDYDSEDRNSNG